MRTNIFGIKGDTTKPDHHSKRDIQTVQTYFPEHIRDIYSEKKPSFLIEQDNSSIITMPACDDSGVMFENLHDLQNHLKRWCPEQQSLKRGIFQEDIISDKKTKYDLDDESSVMDTDRENEVYADFAELTKRRNFEE